MVKRILGIIIVLMLWSTCLGEESVSQPEKLYEQATMAMVSQDFAQAAASYESLQGYQDAAQMALYCKAMDAASKKMYRKAGQIVEGLGDFKDAPLLLKYYQALELESLKHYEQAMEIYTDLGAYKDAEQRFRTCSELRLELLRGSWPVPGETELFEAEGQGSLEEVENPLPIHCGVCLNGTEGSNECTMAIVGPQGDLYMWGTNIRFRFGNGTDEPSAVPLWITDNVSKVVLSDGNRTYLLKRDGTLWMCGTGWYGDEYDLMPTVKTFTFLMDHVIDVVAGNVYTAVLKDDHSVWIWGDISDTTGNLGLGSDAEQGLNLEPQKVMEGIASISAGRWNLAAFDGENHCYVLGNNQYGELGQYTLKPFYKPVYLTSDVKVFSAGGAHIMLLKEDGTAWDSGYNGTGQLGWGTTNWRNSCYHQIASNVELVCAGEFSSFYVDQDHKLYGTGYNTNGQLGVGDLEDRLVFTYATDDVYDVSATGRSTAVIKGDGSIWVTGRVTALMPDLVEDTTVFVRTPYNLYEMYEK